MSFFDRFKQQKLLTFSLLMFTLAVGIVIGTLVSTGVNAATRPRPGARRDSAGDPAGRENPEPVCRTRQAG